MQTIFELKELAVVDTPLLLFDCVLPGGRMERWSTHGVTVSGATYEARVLEHNVFEMQTASDHGTDGIPRISIVLANADSHFSQIERAEGWKGASLTVGFLFYDLRNDAPLTELSVLFRGTCNPPDEIREATFRITATNRMNLQRLLLPQVRVQRRCPWEFPASQEQRLEGFDGGVQGMYSRYYRCGYSADIAGGMGLLDGGSPFVACGYTRPDCQARGMLNHFGGIEFVPSAIAVRTYGDKSSHTSAVSVNEARYNDFVPMVYGTAWYTPPVVFARNDGNLTRMEVLLGLGEMQGVIKVLVNDVEIPVGAAGTNMTGTGWYNVPTMGTRTGAFNLDFLDGSGQPLGDPYGSMAYLSVVVPNRLNDGKTLPRVTVLAQGLKLPVYDLEGVYTGAQFTNNPAWVLLDVLRRAGWRLSEIDVASFALAAAYCDEPIEALDLYGSPITLPRFECNLLLQKRKSAGDLVRGVRNGARLLLTYASTGALQVRVENSVALERPSRPEWSNSTESLNGGWPSYEFGDGTSGISGILRKGTGEPSLRVFSRSMADTPNRFSVEFQDALNEYQQDSFSLVDPDDIARTGQEISTTVAAVGIPHFDQAARILKLNLDKSIRGNSYIEFQTSVRSFGIRPGDLIAITYLKEGLGRQLFRVSKIAPGVNHRISTITAQIHDDAWYLDSNGKVTSSSGGRRQGEAGVGIPKPLMGSVLDDDGEIQFGIEETVNTTSDGTNQTSVSVSFVPPTAAATAGPGIPLLSLAATVGGGGTLHGNQTLYYAVSGVDATGNEGLLSFIVRAAITNDGSSVALSRLSFPPETSAFHAYRGSTPAVLFRIASDQPLAVEFSDGGLEKQLIAPPDTSFDHANFYWRMELQPQAAATIRSTNSIGNDSLQMTGNRYRGMITRITHGRGAGQERVIAANTETVLTISPAWDVLPDAGSSFVVAEAGWQFGALTNSSPVQFEVPNRSGEVVHISGRAANVNDAQCAAELSIVTRWQIGGSGTNDDDIPPKPFFGLGPGQMGGTLELSGVSFTDLTNTRTISAATLTLYYWDELGTPPATTLANSVAQTDTFLDLNVSGAATVGCFLQLDSEVIRVDEVQNGGMRYIIARGAHGSAAAAHAGATPIYTLRSKTVIAALTADFFGSPYSGSWSYPVVLPDVRVASAELFVTNQRGKSPTQSIYLTSTIDRGLRTLSGGQYSIQVDGYLSVEQSVAPAVIVDTSHSVRDVFAVLGKPADAAVMLQVHVDNAPYCGLTFAPGTTTSDAAAGNLLPPLPAGAKITVSVLSVGTVYPGADLTVLIRL